MVEQQKYSVFAERNIFFDAIRERYTGISNDHPSLPARACDDISFANEFIMPSSCRMMEASMGDVINLKRFKKRSEREQSAKQAEANRARFGRTKSERALEERRKDRAERSAGPAPHRWRRRVMKSPVVKRSIVVAGHKTSVSLEEAFWNGMKEISGLRDMTLVRAGRRDRQQPPAGQSVLGDPSLRAGLFPHPRHAGRRAGRAAAAG